jgi:hypothetical protein
MKNSLLKSKQSRREVTGIARGSISSKEKDKPNKKGKKVLASDS